MGEREKKLENSLKFEKLPFCERNLTQLHFTLHTTFSSKKNLAQKEREIKLELCLDPEANIGQDGQRAQDTKDFFKGYGVDTITIIYRLIFLTNFIQPVFHSRSTSTPPSR